MTKIEWTEKTWNPIVGCSIVSPGCTNCYAMKMAGRLERIDAEERASGRKGMPHYAGTTKASKAGPVWTGKMARAPGHILTEPLRRKKPATYFVNSMSDLFHEDVPDAWIDEIFAVMALSPQHTFQVLTKRSARMRGYLSKPGVARRVYEEACDLVGLLDLTDVVLIAPASDERLAPSGRRIYLGLWPLPNVWLGVSAERQDEADARIPDLLATPAAIRFVSAEPLLGPIDFTFIGNAPGEPGNVRYNALTGHALPFDGVTRGANMWATNKAKPGAALDWIIVGGESGPGARPMHPDWVRSIRDQCKGRDDSLHSLGLPDTAFFFKQWGEWAPGENCGAPPTRTERTASWWVDEWMFSSLTATASREGHADDEPDLYRIGKARAGRLLDGREWNEQPSAARTRHPEPAQ